MDHDTLHPFFINWIQKFACSVSKTILGQIRGKYQVLPSPGGGAQLNGEQLVREGNEEKALLMQALLTEIEEPAAFSTF